MGWSGDGEELQEEGDWGPFVKSLNLMQSKDLVERDNTPAKKEYQATM
jgi:hypothetical protein